MRVGGRARSMPAVRSVAPDRLAPERCAPATALAAALMAAVAVLAGGAASAPRGSVGPPQWRETVLQRQETVPQGPGAARQAPASAASSQPITDEQIVSLLRAYLRVDTSNPPGNELRGARFFKDLFDREGIAVEVFEFSPGRADLVAR